MKKLMNMFLLILIFTLTSCGGSGSSNGTNLTPSLDPELQNGFGGSGAALETLLKTDIILFQGDFISSSIDRGGAITQNGTNQPEGFYSFVDPNDSFKLKFIVTSWINNRAMIFNTMPTSSSATPDVVLGQASFTSGTTNSFGGVTAKGFNNLTAASVCPTGELLLADYSNNRVLIWNTVPKSNGKAADIVIGQVSMTSNSVNQGGTTAGNTLAGGIHILCTANGKLLVSDLLNHRILVFNSIPQSNNVNADVVIGQTDMTSSSHGCSSTKLRNPRGMVLKGNELIVADTGNHRILTFNNIPTSNGESASEVVGQDDFTSCAVNRSGTVGSDTLNRPNMFSVKDNILAVSDRSNHRVVFYNFPLSNASDAFGLYGQSNFTSNTSPVSATNNNVKSPISLLFQEDHLWISDQGQNRIIAVPHNL